MLIHGSLKLYKPFVNQTKPYSFGTWCMYKQYSIHYEQYLTIIIIFILQDYDVDKQYTLKKILF